MGDLAAVRSRYHRLGAVGLPARRDVLRPVTTAVQELLELPYEQRTRLESDPYFDQRFDYTIDDAALAYQDRSAAE